MIYDTRRLGRGGLTTEKLLDEIYVELFRCAVPSADFHAMLRSGEAKRADFFMRYYLHDNRQDEIIRRICRAHCLGRLDIDGVRTAVVLGCAPNGNHTSWMKCCGKLAEQKKRWLRIQSPSRIRARAKFAKKAGKK